ncbi:SDR family NAD(P)-dependent oxidoreductase [Nocardiopsis potens]|uniref:SDR family NAD(P)-dependent oxidoreductase n=1 Tax=Nocardiopsis potens TaxID=1246458 RepID=UPI00034BC7D4|nr:SDR family oxidoreductase [Nocardiopsis potens]
MNGNENAETATAQRFAGRTALVTGGTSGIGLAAAARFLAEGARVVITGRDAGRLEAAAKELDAPGRVLAVRGDASSAADLDALAERIREWSGGLDAVFANAGTASFEHLEDTTEEEIGRVLGANFTGVYLTVQKALPLIRRGGAVVINASWTLHRSLPSSSLYAATKAAVHNLARTFAVDLADRGVRVNSVSPGYITTPMFHGAVDPAEIPALESRIPAGRLGGAEEVAPVVAFLASGDASYVNGQDIIIDGGLTTAAAA